MSLTLQYELVQHSLTSIGSNVIRYGALALSQSAQVGEPAISENTWDDFDGSWVIKGYREFWAYETAAPSNNRLVYNGFVLSRTYHRDSSFRTGSARRITVETGDGNTALGWRILFDGSGANSANRPAETAGDRIRWLVNQSLRLPSLYAHPTIFANPTNAMDACDYRGQRYNDVLADVANTTGYDFFVQYDEGRQRSELLFLDPNGSDYPSTVSLSNSLSDINSTTVFAPSEDAEMHRDPSRIAGGVYIAYDGGSIYQTRQSIYDEFALVDQTAPLGNVKSATKARAIATRYQDDNDEEDDRVTCSIVVPAASVNLLRQGMLTAATFTHFPGWETNRACRVMKRTVIQEEDLGQDYYRIALELSPTSSSVAGSCSTSMSNAISTTLDQPQVAASGTLSLAVSPVVTGSHILIPVFSVTSGNPGNSLGAFTGGYSTLEYDNTTQVGVALRIGFQQGTSPATFTAGSAWTAFGDGGNLAIHAAIPSSATSAVQSNYQTGGGGTGLSSAPTTGNIVVMVCHGWGTNVITGPVAPGPTTGWTLIGSVSNVSTLPVPPYNGINRASLAVYARCVAAGETGEYGFGVSGGFPASKATYLAEFTV